jgi:hypothetical protein
VRQPVLPEHAPQHRDGDAELPANLGSRAMASVKVSYSMNRRIMPSRAALTDAGGTPLASW